MVRFLIRRSASALIVLWLVSSLTFIAVRSAPGIPAVLLQTHATPPLEQVQLWRALGLEQGLGRQYTQWMASAVSGDWGASFTHGRPVLSVLASHLPATVLLGSTSLLLAFGLGVPLGLFCGRRAHSPADHALRLITAALHSVPPFWLGLMAIMVFSYRLRVFPPGHLRQATINEAGLLTSSLDVLHHLALPATVLGCTMAAGVCRTLRASILERLDQSHVRAARAKGLSERRIFLAHVLPGSLRPIIEYVGLALPLLCGGILAIEVVFSWPGMGRLTYAAIQTRDYPLIVGSTALTAVLVVAGTLIADLLQGLLDPRLRLSGPL